MVRDNIEADVRLIDERGPTIERMVKAGHFQVGDIGTIQVRDAPLERSHARKIITDGQYNAGCKFRLHWYHAGLSDTVGSIDPNRIFATDQANFSAMAKTENQVFHRQRFRGAVRELGLKGTYVIEYAICKEYPFETIGYGLGWTNKSQAIAAATEAFRSALDKLCDLWGIAR